MTSDVETTWGSSRPVIAGSSIGLLLGVLLGLSATPVVASVVAALIAAAGAYWSVVEQTKTATEESANPAVLAARQVATAALCLACVAGLCAGLWLRARDAFGLTPAEQVRKWEDAGFSKSDAQAIVALKGAGLLKSGYSAQSEAVSPARSTVLFSATTSQCQQLDPEDFADGANLRTAFSSAGGNWGRFADAVHQLEPDAQLRALRAAWQLVCR